MAVFDNMKVRAKLMVLTVALVLPMVAVGVMGLRGMATGKDYLETVYREHTEAAVMIGRIVTLNRDNVSEMFRAFQHNPAHEYAKLHDHSTSEHLKRIEKNREELTELWKQYEGIAKTPEGKALADKFRQARTAFVQEVLNPASTSVGKEDFSNDVVRAFLKGNRESGKVTAETGDALIAYHKAESQRIYQDFTARYETLQRWVAGLIVAALALALWLGMAVLRSINRPLGLMQATMDIVANGADFSRRVAVSGSDEVGMAAQAFNRLLETQQRAIAEVNRVVGAIAAGNFNERVNSDLKGDLAVMKTEVNASAHSVKTTMAALDEVMKALHEGDFGKRMSGEVKGEIKQSVDQAMQAMQTMLGDVGKVMAGVAQGDLAQRVNAQGSGDLAKLKEDINRSLDALGDAMRTVSHNTRQVAAASSQTSTAIGQISDGAQNQMHAINQVANAVRETSKTVQDVSTNTEAASRKAKETATIVSEGKRQMDHMVEVVNSIAANSEKINKITEVIEKIANKTNLLSLNAAIEAARAGEHGKGFAVVAEEVGKLAASSAESTQEIAQLVQHAVVETNRAVETVKQVSQGMDKIEEGAVQSDAMLQRIAAALEQQSAAVREINNNVSNLNQIAESNAAASEEITATVVELSKIADNTRREVEKFRV